jgi:plastocyanin
MTIKRIAIALAAVALLTAACGGDDGDSGDGAAGGGGGGATVTLTAADFAFDPASLTASAGDTIEFTNEDDAMHNFLAEDLDLDEDVDAGSSTTIALDNVEPGTYDFVCKFHESQMTGTLEVQ